jgi:hypothetical protein
LRAVNRAPKVAKIEETQMLEWLSVAVWIIGASKSEAPPEAWRCTNQVEVWCSADSCATSAADETTPLDITASSARRISICAYSGCWEGEAGFWVIEGRRLWAAKALPFTSGLGESDATLLIEPDGVGFVRAGGLATPVLCERTVLAPGAPGD